MVAHEERLQPPQVGVVRKVMSIWFERRATHLEKLAPAIWLGYTGHWCVCVGIDVGQTWDR